MDTADPFNAPGPIPSNDGRLPEGYITREESRARSEAILARSYWDGFAPVAATMAITLLSFLPAIVILALK